MTTIMECDNCGFETKVELYPDMHTGNYWFCDVCAATYLSKATRWAEQVDDPNLYKSIGYIANMILAEIKKAKE